MARRLTPEVIYDIWASFTGGGLSPASQERFLSMRGLLAQIGQGGRDVVTQAAQELYDRTGKVLLADWAKKVPKASSKYRPPEQAKSPRPSFSQAPGQPRHPRDSRLHSHKRPAKPARGLFVGRLNRSSQCVA